MADYCKLIIVGRFVRDPELKYTPSQKAVCEFSLAWSKKSGGQQTSNFIDCVAWEKSGETINQYMKKGDAILVEGELRQERWEDKSGQKRSKLKMTVYQFQFLGDGQKHDEQPGPPMGQSQAPPPQRQAPPQQSPPAQQPAATPAQPAPPQETYAGPTGGYVSDGPDDSNIPFSP